MTVGSAEKPAAPPYLSYVTFRNFLDSLREGIPQYIDASTMPNLSGQNKGLVRAAFRFLGLTDPEDVPTGRLQPLVEAEAKDREVVWAQIIREAYSFLFEDPGFDLAKATKNQFHSKFVTQGLGAETARKAEVFFLAAAREAAISISPYITKGTRPGRQVLTTRGRSSSKRGALPLTDPVKTDGRESQRRADELPRGGAAAPSPLSPREMMIRGLFEDLPAEGQTWTAAERERWFNMAEAVIERFVPVRGDPADATSRSEQSAPETNSV